MRLSYSTANKLQKFNIHLLMIHVWTIAPIKRNTSPTDNFTE